MRWWAWLTVVVGLVVCLIYATLWSLEDGFLLHPKACDHYANYANLDSEIHRLDSGGLVLHVGKSNGRSILCLHGNAGNVDGMANLARTLLERGYDVYLLEYAGYGMCAKHRPATQNLVRDLECAWAEVIPKDKRGDAILFGFSMGGGVIGQFLNQPNINDLPAQIVLLNTYYDLPMLVSDIFPIPGVSQLMHTRWNAQPGIQRYCQLKQGAANVLVVAAVDDELIPFQHAHLILQSIQDATTQRKLVPLPHGGHNNSIETHFDLWLPNLLAASQ